MSDLENREGGAPRQSRAYGRASDNAHVYQSGANQYVTHFHITAEARGQAAHEARERADVVVQVLTRAVGEWAARCQELEEKARRAKAEGRAEAHAEFAQKLRDAELRVMQAQRTMRQAEEERRRAEALLAQAQQELARHRRVADRDGEDTSRHDLAGMARDRQETEQFSELLERAEAELGAVREELRQLGGEIDGQGDGRGTAQVIEGQWTRQSGMDEQPVPVRAVAADGDAGAPAADPPARSGNRTPVPGPPRYSLIGVAWVVCALPPCVPMLVVTANRAAYASDASLWGVVPFTFGTVLVGVVAVFLGLVLAVMATTDMLNRDSEVNASVPALLLSLVATAVFLVAAFFTPLSWPGPAGEWGRGLASAVGLG
ncbi:hypothetical protein ACIQ8D_10730 [Streptomyces sp. NPDC096094]|uniref:hypothetical protein n=1 Tax=Streptomyces sp. NPDC096094 TaxID=3366073 RepID=UPI003817DE5A